MPRGGEPLVKPVAATEGDVVTTTERSVTVNGTPLAASATLPVDSKGRPLPYHPFGRHRLEPGELWLFSPAPRSWDSRYFGPIRKDQVVATVVPVFTIEEGIDIPKELGRWQKAGDPRVFKLIVSPEAGDDLDLPEHARALMREVERNLGAGLEWIAIDHHNTDNPHVHIVLRGVDTQGQELRIDRDHVKAGFRQRSQEVATRALGLRTERSLLSARERAVERQQFTEIDHAILRRAGEDGIVRYDGPIPDSASRRKLRLLELRRLALLSEMGLAERIGERSWKLGPNLETALCGFQRAHDVLKTRARHHELIRDPKAPLVRTDPRPGLVLTGKVVGTGLADEGADRRYVLLEGTEEAGLVIGTDAAESSG